MLFVYHFLFYRIRLLISKTDSALESKANTASLENELDELQKNMSKWKNNAQKLKMER